MSLTRPYPALAGVAALLIVAGIVVYQIRPVSEPVDLARWSAEAVSAGASGEERSSEPSMAGDSMADAVAAARSRVLMTREQQQVGRSVRTAEVSESRPSAAIAAQETAEAPSPGYRDQGRDQFTAFDPNPVKVAAEEPVSTFSIDVDTASYAFMRASLNRGVLPPPDAVRVEELVNYFPYDYAPPESSARPFAVHVSLMPTPWNDATRLMHIGIEGYALTPDSRPPANLVFLIDTSGSMDAPDKLPLLINSFRLLLDALAPDDTVAIVTYAGAAGTVLAPTPVAERAAIAAALESLRAGGSTAGAEGIRQAYMLAERHFVDGGVNRVILATDGDFNVGITDPDELEGFVERKRKAGVLLSVLGFGMGNYNDALMQRLAQNGNGNAAYIDTLSEARKVLVEEATSTLFPIAKDVKIQVEFNPALVSEYRLIGYETRLLAREDFRNDKVDAGEIGAGHAVTALYEVTPVGLGRRAHRAAPLSASGSALAGRPRGRAGHGVRPLQAARGRDEHGDRAARDRGRCGRKRGECARGCALRRRRGRLRAAVAGRALYRGVRLRRRDRRRPGREGRGPVRLPRGVPRPRPPGQNGCRHGTVAWTIACASVKRGAGTHRPIPSRPGRRNAGSGMHP